MTLILPIPLEQIRRVAFFKRDELTSDLICCEIASDDQQWLFHEEMDGWQSLLGELDRLPAFRTDWYERVSQPPFASSPIIAYDRPHA